MAEKGETLFLCIGGPFDMERMPYSVLRNSKYEMYNCAQRHARHIFAEHSARNAGECIPPSCVWIHKSLFEKAERHAES